MFSHQYQYLPKTVFFLNTLVKYYLVLIKTTILYFCKVSVTSSLETLIVIFRLQFEMLYILRPYNLTILILFQVGSERQFTQRRCIFQVRSVDFSF